jgi:hypothetical protein
LSRFCLHLTWQASDGHAHELPCLRPIQKRRQLAHTVPDGAVDEAVGLAGWVALDAKDLRDGDIPAADRDYGHPS